jgi:hypothetical protein
MQIFLLSVVVILSIVLYKMLSSYRATYPFIRTTRLTRTDDNSEFLTTETEHGLITIERDTVVVDGTEYGLSTKKGKEAEAYLTIDGGKLISVSIRLTDGEKLFFIDPEHSLFANPYHHNMSEGSAHRHIFSF